MNDSSDSNDRLWSAPLLSIHSTQGPVGRPSAATGIVLMYWLVTATATIGGTGEQAARVVRVAVTTARHICSGSCSAPPPSRKTVATGCDDQASVVPVSSTSATFGPPVPRSIASTHPLMPPSVRVAIGGDGVPAARDGRDAVADTVLHRQAMSSTDPQLPPASGAGRPGAGSVLQFLGPSTGGIRVHVGELTRRLGERGWRVGVAGPHGVMDGVGDQTADVDVPTSWHPGGILRARRQLVPLVTGPSAPSVVHVHGLKAALVALDDPTARDGRPWCSPSTTSSPARSRALARRLLSSVERAIVRRVDHVIVISPEIGERRRAPPTGRPARTTSLPVSPRRTPDRPGPEVRAGYGIGPTTRRSS